MDNATARQKGVSIGKAMENLDIPTSGTYEQGFTRFGRVFKMFTQAAPELRRLPSDVLNVATKGLSFDEAARGNEALYIFLVVLAFVYLVLAAQYESLLLPLAVVLSLPVGVFGSFSSLKRMGLANDIYAQLGLAMQISLLRNNAAPLVEFAAQKQHEGATVMQAAIGGAKVRFRPILTTSFAFIAGLLPLVPATEPGAAGNRTIGASAPGGLLFGTILGALLGPSLYFIFGTLAEGRSLICDQEDRSLTGEVAHHA